MLLYCSFKLTLSSYFTYFCALVLSRVFMMLCIFFHYLNSAVSDNKYELIQVALLLDITIHKMKYFISFVAKERRTNGD